MIVTILYVVAEFETIWYPNMKSLASSHHQRKGPQGYHPGIHHSLPFALLLAD